MLALFDNSPQALQYCTNSQKIENISRIQTKIEFSK